MISQREVQRLAFERHVPERMIELDYILTWMLGALASPKPSPRLIAKGGTALKKLYFADWRYSEDLDFTAAEIVEPDAFKILLTQACHRVRDAAGLETDVGSLEPRRDGGVLRNITAYMNYIGPLQRTRRPRQMKVDVTFDEIIVNAPVARPLIRSFSDEPEPPLRVAVYPLEEICAEKMRTLLQRTEPRDLYDVWRILSERADAMDAQKLATTLRVKCEHRGVSFTHVSALLSPERVSKYRGAWERRLREQTPDIPPLNTVVRETRRLLRTFVG
jgi:predicted nucleotidyltransferase component of viral defense system